MLRTLKITALVSLILLLNAATSLLILQSRVPALAQGSGCAAGDVNGDALVDIADPVYLLNHLFGEGPEPVACASTDLGGAMLWARAGAITPAGFTPMFSMFGYSAPAVEDGLNSVALPRGGTIHSLVATKSDLPNYSGDFSVTLLVDGLPTDLTASTTDNPPENNVDVLTVAKGSRISFRFVGLDTEQAAGTAMVIFE